MDKELDRAHIIYDRLAHRLPDQGRSSMIVGCPDCVRLRVGGTGPAVPPHGFATPRDAPSCSEVCFRDTRAMCCRTNFQHHPRWLGNHDFENGLAYLISVPIFRIRVVDEIRLKRIQSHDTSYPAPLCPAGDWNIERVQDDRQMKPPLFATVTSLAR